MNMSQLKQKLIDVRSMAMTTDLWSDRKNRSYLCLAGHSPDNDMTMQSTIKHFQTFDDRHLPANIRAEVKSRLRELDIEHKTITITGDGVIDSQISADSSDSQDRDEEIMKTSEESGSEVDPFFVHSLEYFEESSFA